MGMGASVIQSTSYINGMQAVILISEMIKNNYGMAARWLLISGEATMFYGGSDVNYLNHPHAEFYYLTYLQNFYGDQVTRFGKGITKKGRTVKCLFVILGFPGKIPLFVFKDNR